MNEIKVSTSNIINNLKKKKVELLQNVIVAKHCKFIQLILQNLFAFFSKCAICVLQNLLISLKLTSAKKYLKQTSTGANNNKTSRMRTRYLI